MHITLHYYSTPLCTHENIISVIISSQRLQLIDQTRTSAKYARSFGDDASSFQTGLTSWQCGHHGAMNMTKLTLSVGRINALKLSSFGSVMMYSSSASLAQHNINYCQCYNSFSITEDYTAYFIILHHVAAITNIIHFLLAFHLPTLYDEWWSTNDDNYLSSSMLAKPEDS